MWLTKVPASVVICPSILRVIARKGVFNATVLLLCYVLKYFVVTCPLLGVSVWGSFLVWKKKLETLMIYLSRWEAKENLFSKLSTFLSFPHSEQEA